MPADTDQPTLAVTQADREAAAALRQHMCGCTPGGRPLPSVEAILGGKWDDRETVQAFARHRADHEPRAVELGLREALGNCVSTLCSLRKNYEQDTPLWKDASRFIAEGNTALAAQSPAPAEGEVELLREALKWALPLAERAIDDHRLERIRCGHTDISGTYKNGVTWSGIWQAEVDQIEAARAAARPSTQPQADAGSADHPSTQEGDA